MNLPRINPKAPKPSDALRNWMRAPAGHKVVVVDLSGIELRVNHFLWQEPSSIALFKADPERADLYKEFAARLYDKPVEEIDKNERQMGKIAQLGLGYGAGAGTFKRVAKAMGGIGLDDGEAVRAVNTWRGTYTRITAGWRTCHESLVNILHGEEVAIDPWGLCVTCAEGIRIPGGMIRYPNLRQERNDETGKAEWVYAEGRHKARIYAGKIDENVIQALSRQIICGHLLEIRRRTGRLPQLEVYDELVYVVPEEDAQSQLETMLDVMRTAPPWFPELCLWAEGDIADTYGSAK